MGPLKARGFLLEARGVAEEEQRWWEFLDDCGVLWASYVYNKDAPLVFITKGAEILKREDTAGHHECPQVAPRFEGPHRSTGDGSAQLGQPGRSANFMRGKFCTVIYSLRTVETCGTI